MSVLSRLYYMDVTREVITTSRVCRDCHGRRYVDGVLCRDCNGNGVHPHTLRVRDPRKVVLRNLGILVVVGLGIFAIVWLKS